MKKWMAVMVAVLLLVGMLPTVGALAAEEKALIRDIGVKRMVPPLDGNTPSFNAVPLNDAYVVEAVEWLELDNYKNEIKTMSITDKFRAEHYYEAHIWLTVKDADAVFSLTETPTINANYSFLDKTDSDEKRVHIYRSFGDCAQGVGAVVLTAAEPVVGGAPSFAAVDTTAYRSIQRNGYVNQTNGVTWTEESTGVNLTAGDAFEADKTYKVTYVLEVKHSFVFAGATTFTINGVEADVYSLYEDDNGKTLRCEVSLGGLKAKAAPTTTTNPSDSATKPEDGPTKPADAPATQPNEGGAGTTATTATTTTATAGGGLFGLGGMLGDGTIVWIAAGSLALLMLIAVLVFVFTKKKTPPSEE